MFRTRKMRDICTGKAMLDIILSSIVRPDEIWRHCVLLARLSVAAPHLGYSDVLSRDMAPPQIL